MLLHNFSIKTQDCEKISLPKIAEKGQRISRYLNAAKSQLWNDLKQKSSQKKKHRRQFQEEWKGQINDVVATGRSNDMFKQPKAEKDFLKNPQQLKEQAPSRKPDPIDTRKVEVNNQ